MIKLSLNIGERLVLSSVINTFGKGLSLSEMTICIKILEKVDISEVERKKVGLEVKDQRLTWKDMDYVVDIELNDDEKKLVDNFMDKMDKEKQYSVKEGKILLNLINKLQKK